jgi:subtilase family serine protease
MHHFSLPLKTKKESSIMSSDENNEKVVKPIYAAATLLGLITLLTVCIQVLKLPTRSSLVLCIV